MITKHIPNTITCLNLFSGCLAIVAAFNMHFELAFCLILLAALFDFMDGMAARMLKAYSPLGKELDSLADLISFGMAPACMVYNFLAHVEQMPTQLTFLAFVIPVFSALRLAKFNIDERQTTSFIGLPTPANAIFWGGLISMYTDFLQTLPYVVILLAIALSLLLVAELPLFSLKIKSLKWAENKVRYTFIVGCAVLLALFQLQSFVWIIVWYIALSVCVWIGGKCCKK